MADLPGQAIGAQPADSKSPAPRRRYAVVTPYYRESRRLLERCMKSVQRQSIMVDHIMVADGFAQEWIDHEPVYHLKLETSHGDYGNTPRGLGALLAVSQGYSGIAFLDADNWFAADHVERCLEAAMTLKNCDYVIAKRYFVRPDETIIPFGDEKSHVDTSCYFFLEGAYHILHHWITMPRSLSVLCDRVFYAAANSYKLRSAVVSQPTVYYECLYASVYEVIGETPPPNAKPDPDFSTVSSWLRSLNDADLWHAVRRSGTLLNREARGLAELYVVSRNAACPCGSGKRFKHCHGAFGGSSDERD